jgi:uncharacterized protein (DUF433 family)
MSNSDRLVIDPRIHFGKPCVAGTRILVEHVLELIQEGIQPMVRTVSRGDSAVVS